MVSSHLPGDTDVPSNKFDLDNHADLQRRETPLALRRLIELQHNPIRGYFDTAHLQSIHRYLFQDVYGWAGELRIVDISKPNAHFPPPQYLKASLDALFAELKREKFLKDLSPSAWANRAAYYLGEINAIHPFREGNGRTQREFIRELAARDEHFLTWSVHSQREMIDASRLSFLKKDYSGIERIILAALRIPKCGG